MVDAMKKFIANCILLSLLVSSAVSNAQSTSLLERLEIAAEQISQNQYDFYLSRAPELEGKLPSVEWDEEIRAASKCILDGIQLAKGEKIAEAYVAAMEKDAKLTIRSLDQMANETSIPDELKGNDTTIETLAEQCNTMEITAARLKESGFWDAMMQPGIMEKMMAQ